MLESRLVWPKPPETARIRYVGALSTETDLKRGVSWSEGLGQLIFGKKRIGVMLAPYAVAIDENDRLFVSDATAAVVHMFDLDTRRYKQFADIEGEEKLRKPVGIAIAGKRVYVVDSALHKVCAFNKDGKFIFSFGEERLKRPCGIAYLEAEGKTYVADAAKHVVDIFAKDGEFMYQIGSRGLQAGMFNFPTHLWIDRQGYLYVSDTCSVVRVTVRVTSHIHAVLLQTATAVYMSLTGSSRMPRFLMGRVGYLWPSVRRDASPVSFGCRRVYV
jgi:DNA-binding beta-propeller fold protein YncE